MPAERFETLRRELGDGFIAVEIDSSPGNPWNIPKRAHSVLTNDFVDEPGHPTRDALDQVLAFFSERLRARARVADRRGFSWTRRRCRRAARLHTTLPVASTSATLAGPAAAWPAPLHSPFPSMTVTNPSRSGALVPWLNRIAYAPFGTAYDTSMRNVALRLPAM